MSKPKISVNSNTVAVDSNETTLAKRVLNSSLSDEDKISLIQLIGNHQNIISIPSVWDPNPQPLNPTYYKLDAGTGSPKTPESAATCTKG